LDSWKDFFPTLQGSFELVIQESRVVLLFCTTVYKIDVLCHEILSYCLREEHHDVSFSYIATKMRSACKLSGNARIGPKIPIKE